METSNIVKNKNENSARYRVNDIFYSLQGEGANAGRAAIFVRFAGCNLKCPFCDTEFDSFFTPSADYIVTEILAHCIDHGVLKNKPMVVLTGGEPTLQVDEHFVDLLHEEGFYVAMESNGTRPAPQNLDWLTVSPKETNGVWNVKYGKRKPDELKVVFEKDTPEKLPSLHIPHSPSGTTPQLFLQPCDTGNKRRNAAIVAACVKYIAQHPEWRLSLQIHKIIGIE